MHVSCANAVFQIGSVAAMPKIDHVNAAWATVNAARELQVINHTKPWLLIKQTYIQFRVEQENLLRCNVVYTNEREE